MKIIIKQILFLVSILALVAGAQAEGDAAAGKSKVAVCAACHGNDGNSIISANPKLAGQGEKYLYKQLRDIQSGERSAPLMAGMLDGLNDQDLENIAAYYSSQNPTPSAAEAEWVEVGRELYRAGNAERGIPSCMGCHGPAGQGNAPAGYPLIAGQHAEYLAQQLRQFSAGARANDGEGRAMRDIAGRLNENEIKALASYVAGLRAE